MSAELGVAPPSRSGGQLASEPVTALVFMMVLLGAFGFGVGTVELAIWLAALVVGILLIVRRRRNARASMEHPGLS